MTLVDIESVILNQRMAMKRVLSYSSGSINASAQTTVAVTPTAATETWIVTKIVYGNINSSVWTVSINHDQFDGNSSTAEASFVGEAIDAWIEVSPGHKLNYILKNNNTVAETFDFTVFLLVFTDPTALAAAKRMITGLGNFYSLLGSIRFDGALHSDIMTRLVDRLLAQPPAAPGVEEELGTGTGKRSYPAIDSVGPSLGTDRTDLKAPPAVVRPPAVTVNPAARYPPISMAGLAETTVAAVTPAKKKIQRK